MPKVVVLLRPQMAVGADQRAHFVLRPAARRVAVERRKVVADAGAVAVDLEVGLRPESRRSCPAIGRTGCPWAAPTPIT